jgi:hypothetical protein
LNKCAAKKAKCVNKFAGSLLNCHVRAEIFGYLDPYCEEKADRKWDGDIYPYKGCFEKLELPSHCFTEDDTSSVGATVDAFVLDVVTQLDPSYPTPVVDRCSAAKKKCTIKLASGLLKCRAKYESKNLPVDPGCNQKVLDKFDGGIDPTRGCFEKLEAKFVSPAPPCPTLDDTANLELTVNDFVQDLACTLDPYLPECSTCGNNVAESPPEDCDGTDDGACPGNCSSLCACP